MKAQNTLTHAFKTRSINDLISQKQHYLHEAAKHPIGSLRRKFFLSAVDRIAAIIRQQISTTAYALQGPGL